MVAARYGYSPEIVETLLDAGADPAVEHEGKRAYDYSLENEVLKDSPVIERLR